MVKFAVRVEYKKVTKGALYEGRLFGSLDTQKSRTFWTPAIIGEGEIIRRSFHETVCHVG